VRIVFIILAGLLVSADAIADNCELPLDAVLDRYVSARGGHAAMEEQRALRIRSTNHEGKWNPEFDYRVMKPGYMWIRATYDDGVSVEEGYDGERGWEHLDGKPAEYVGGDAGKALNQGAQSPVHLYGLQHMEPLGAKVALDGCATIDDTHYYVINVKSRFGTDIDYYVSSGDFHLERGRSVRPLHPTEDPTPITIEERWGDFRMVSGVLHPFAYSQWNVDTGERLAWLEIHSIEFDDEATEATFAKPGE
jgi:hypothetical protein